MLTRLFLCAPVVPFLVSPFFSLASATNYIDPFSSGCSRNGPVSCHNSSAETNPCCFESPGGLLAQVQFWDTTPSTGPSDSWTIHGLWPDNCDGTYTENCDPSRDYTDIAGILSDQGASDTLEYMQTYWVDFRGKDENFWEHEWSTHGTCFNTLNPTCLPSDSPQGAEAVAYFRTVVGLFKTLPTYQWLSDAGITPDNSATYTLTEITSALAQATGFTPALDCKGHNIDEIYWYFNLRGSGIDGTFIPIDAPRAGNCKSSGLRYPPKTSRSSSGTVNYDENFAEVPMVYMPLAQGET